MRRITGMLAVTTLALALVPAAALAQQAGSAFTRIEKHETFNLRGHVSFLVSAGWDLDVLGDVTKGTQGSGGTIILTTHYPDVYYALPVRKEIAFGVGFQPHTEAIVILGFADNKSQPVSIGLPGSELIMNASDYRDRAIDFGFRHWFATGNTFRQYMNFTYGRHWLDQINATFKTPGGQPTLIPMRLYSKSNVPSLTLSFGLSYEKHHVGAFVQAGARYVARFKRNDDDLALFGLQTVNNTGGRFYLPVQFGILFRL